MDIASVIGLNQAKTNIDLQMKILKTVDEQQKTILDTLSNSQKNVSQNSLVDMLVWKEL